MIETSLCRAFRRQLLRWYDRHKRDLPWRRRQKDAYAQLLAEVMLQQTQVATVIPYFERFMQRYPTIADLAAADLDEVLALWSGLGYYRRARHLHAATQKIVAEFGGIIPRQVKDLMSLPGIGRYTAGAIASVAYDVAAPVVDGNVTRVLMRWCADRDDPNSPATQAQIWEIAQRLLPRKRCGEFNQALMELGSLVCTPHAPQCTACPVHASCRSLATGMVNRIPASHPRKAVAQVSCVVAAVRRGEQMLFTRRPETGLWAGLWELPSEMLISADSIQTARRRLLDRLPAGTRLNTRPAGRVPWQLSHRLVTFHIFEGTLASAKVSANVGRRRSRWASPAELAGMGISAACKAIIRYLHNDCSCFRIASRSKSLG